MKTTSLAFGAKGLLNPEAVEFFVENKPSTLVVFGDGTQEAYDHIKAFDFSSILDHVTQLSVGRLPMYALRLTGVGGQLTKPNYVYSEQNRRDWFCEYVAAPCISINVSDMTSQSSTKVNLSSLQVVQMCDMAMEFWDILTVAEDHMVFPAIVMDALVPHSRHLTRMTIDIEALRKDTGLSSLEYDADSDMLQVKVASETFGIKLSVLDEFLKDIVLPFFNRYRGRRFRLEVSALGITENNSFQPMTYGELGRTLAQLQQLVSAQQITNANPMNDIDLLLFAKKVKIDEESCLFARGDQTIAEFIETAHSVLVRPSPDAALADSDPDVGAIKELVADHH